VFGESGGGGRWLFPLRLVVEVLWIWYGMRVARGGGGGGVELGQICV
jgi:hypothetical protein